VLFESALAARQKAIARPLGAIEVGRRSDFLVLDALMFSSPEARFADVFVAGRQVVSGGHICHGTNGLASWRQLTQDYVRTMHQLWA